MNRSMVEVYDNFFSKEIHLEIFNRLKQPRWGISGGTKRKPEIFWHFDGLEKENYFSEFIFNLICKNLNRKFSGVNRIYANGQTAGQCGTPHKDDGDLTFLYYPSDMWDLKWQGHLIFLDEMGEGDKIVIHKPNRAVLFDGKQKHYADAPSRFFNGLRISLAYKLWN